MPIDLSWLDEDQSILYARWEAGWTWEDFDRMLVEFDGIIQGASTPVSIVSTVTSIPRGIIARLPSIAQLTSLRHPNFEGSYFISEADLVVPVLNLFLRLAPGFEPYMHVVVSVDEAAARIAELRESQSRPSTE